ncbi:MAG: M48 family metalloprotease [Chitinophaga sp.]|uniref:M56 family metallopeptidase n=1 Tax=Chitinophaga sp. TaxID=1869181 RepID=UPI001B22AB9B|nr:M56 family metallopeptidase [Chitinophaga sp.]MBO9728219.1 M48 family metalloprotease [Chitinophaga sp.]
MNLLPITGDFVRALGWTILHSIWQAFFIHACLRIVLKLWPLAGARIRYNLSLLSLTGIFTWFLATLYMHMQRLQEIRESILFTGDHIVSLPAATSLPPVYPSQDPLVWMFPNLEMCFPFLVMLYVAGMAVMTIKLCSDLFQLQQIRTTRTEPMGAAWDKHLDRLAAQLQIPRKVKLLISSHVQVPVMLGFLKPLILLPVAMVNNLSEAQLEAVLLHELAHIKRNDYLLNIFQSIVETILFFNPFVWLISKTIRIEREHCCDDLVIANTVQPLQYAQALVALEQYRLTANRLTMAAADNKQHLFYRIKRIMEMKTKHLNYSQKFLAVLIIATSLVSIAWLNPAKGKDNANGQKLFAEKHAQDSLPCDNSTDHNAVVTPSWQAKEQFRRQLDAITADTTIDLSGIGTPPPPPPPAPAPNPAAPAPMAPMAPLPPVTPLKSNMAAVAPLPPIPPVPPVPASSFDFNFNSSFYQMTDSTPITISTKIKDISCDDKADKEEVRRQIREAQRSVQMAMKQLKEVDMKKVQAEIQAATKNINWNDISDEARKASLAAMKNVNWDEVTKAQAEVAAALKNIDFAAINKNLNLAYANLDKSGKLRKEIAETNEAKIEDVRKQRAAALADAAKARQEAGKIREENKRRQADISREIDEQTAAVDRARKQADELRAIADKNRKIADEQRAQTDKARKMADEQRRIADKARQDVIREMAADHLLDIQNYSVEKNNNGLFINGVKQPDDVAAKYSKYLKGDHVTIKGSTNTSSTHTEN